MREGEIQLTVAMLSVGLSFGFDSLVILHLHVSVVLLD